MSELIILELTRMCASANGWKARFDRYVQLLENIGMTEEQAEREVTLAYRAAETSHELERAAA